MREKLKDLWAVLKNTGKGFGENSVPKLSAALSYYTLFSLSPMLVVLMGVANLFFSQEIVQGEVYEFIFNTLGSDAAQQIQRTLREQRLSGDTLLATVIGVVTMIIGATSMFGEMQDSINRIWHVKAKPKKAILRLLLSRLTSFSMIIVLAIIMAVSLVLDFILQIFSSKIKDWFNIESVIAMEVLNYTISLGLLFVLFITLFKLMPDVKLKWTQILPGAIFTAVLFFLGKYGIAIYLTQTAATSSYGTAGSIVAILLWVYFSSIILYTGCIFTREYIIYHHGDVSPTNYAVLDSRYDAIGVDAERVVKENKVIEPADTRPLMDKQEIDEK